MNETSIQPVRDRSDADVVRLQPRALLTFVIKKKENLIGVIMIDKRGENAREKI